jgi:hypothetical protein
MIPLDQQKNRGYWKVGHELFDNKVKAILHAQSQSLGLDAISYHYNDAWWNKYDWSKEPSESLEELYVKRARQIREKYDTVILRFSAGSDSYNILRTFVDNDIKIDVVSMNLWTNGDPTNSIVPANIEKEKVAFPLIKQLKEQGAEFEVIVSDVGQFFSTIGDDEEWFLKYDCPRFTVTDIIAHQACKSEEYKKYDNSNTCVIIGCDKPQIWVRDDKIWYFQLGDFLHNLYNPANSMIPEPFYWTADMPEIPIKQSHVLKKFYQHRLDLMDHTPGSPHRRLTNGKTRVIPLIYPKYFSEIDPTSNNELPYYDHTVHVNHLKKEIGVGAHSPRVTGHDFTAHLSPYYRTWKNGIDKADCLIQQEFKNENTIWQDGLKTIRTKPRWLGK